VENIFPINPFQKKSQKQGEHMRKHYFLSSLAIFVAGFVLSAVVDGRRLTSMAPGTLSNSLAPEVAAQIARQPYTIQNWEYRVVNARFLRNDQGGIDSELNRQGRMGFEVCGITQAPGDDLIIVLKRPR
jgi:hypothetical protein